MALVTPMMFTPEVMTTAPPIDITSFYIKGDNNNNNNSNDNSTNIDVPENLPLKYATFKTGQITFIVFLLLMIVVGNIIVIIAVLKSHRRSRMTFFIMHLAISDLLVGVLSVLPDLFTYSLDAWLAGEVMCKIVKFGQCIAVYGSTFILVSLSIDRLDAIARPMGFSNSGFRSKVLVAAAWATAGLFSIPTTVLIGTDNCYIQMTDQQWQIYVTLIAFCVFFIPAIIIVLCYGIIICIIWRHNKVLQTSTSGHAHSNHDSSQLYPTKNGFKTNVSPRPVQIKDRSVNMSSRGIIPQAKIKTVKMTVVIVLVFLLCWSPYFVFNLLMVYHKINIKSVAMMKVSALFQSFSPLNSAVNPLIYGIFSSRICRYLKRYRLVALLCKSCACCDDPRDSRMYTQHSEFTGTQYTTPGGFHTTRSKFNQSDTRSDIAKITSSTEMHDLIPKMERNHNAS